MKPGTPAGMQLEPGVNAIFPARTSSLSFFMRSSTQGFRFGLLRSAIRKVGCRPTPLGTKGCAGSWLTGGRRPGRGSKKGPPPLSATHPTLFDEKSGGAAFSCATAGAFATAPMRPAKTLAASNCLKANAHIPAPPYPNPFYISSPAVSSNIFAYEFRIQGLHACLEHGPLFITWMGMQQPRPALVNSRPLACSIPAAGAALVASADGARAGWPDRPRSASGPGSGARRRAGCGGATIWMGSQIASWPASVRAAYRHARSLVSRSGACRARGQR